MRRTRGKRNPDGSWKEKFAREIHVSYLKFDRRPALDRKSKKATYYRESKRFVFILCKKYPFFTRPCLFFGLHFALFVHLEVCSSRLDGERKIFQANIAFLGVFRSTAPPIFVFLSSRRCDKGRKAFDTHPNPLSEAKDAFLLCNISFDESAQSPWKKQQEYAKKT